MTSNIAIFAQSVHKDAGLQPYEQSHKLVVERVSEGKDGKKIVQPLGNLWNEGAILPMLTLWDGAYIRIREAKKDEQ